MKLQHIISFILVTSLLTGCGLDAVQNPNVTTANFVDSPGAARTWVNGARVEMANGIGTISELTELTSDNYYNNRTLTSTVFDIPQILYSDQDVNRLQTVVQQLRLTAEFGLENVLPNDPDATQEQEAELYFYLGVSHLFAGEYFVGLPAEDLGPILEADEHYTKALEAFNEVPNFSSNAKMIEASALARARIAYYRNDISTLRTIAEGVISTAPMLNYQVEFDGERNVNNAFQNYLFDSSQDEFAPLPRLDFLDPKYYSEDGAGQDQKPISLFKVEEAYLMLAEADLAQNNLPAARARLVALLEEVLANRPVNTFDDSRDTRSGGNRSDYPLRDTVRVRFSPGSDPVSGLILDRQAGNISVPAVSGTSVTTADINNAFDIDDLLQLLYRMRQEIFIGEGRRVVDLGIRYPVSEQEQKNNPNIMTNSPYLQAQIPAFIPGNKDIDDFSVNQSEGIVTIKFNMNSVLVQNKSSDAILPLW